MAEEVPKLGASNILVVNVPTGPNIPGSPDILQVNSEVFTGKVETLDNSDNAPPNILGSPNILQVNSEAFPGEVVLDSEDLYLKRDTGEISAEKNLGEECKFFF